LQTWTSCINTIGTCSTPSNTGGSRIVLGGDSTADATGNFPTGGVASSASTVGIALGTSTPGPKIWSGGGDISVTSISAGTGIYSGQFWSGRSFAHSGTGQLKLLKLGENPSSTVEN
jgi:hypothetical protein